MSKRLLFTVADGEIVGVAYLSEQGALELLNRPVEPPRKAKWASRHRPVRFWLVPEDHEVLQTEGGGWSVTPKTVEQTPSDE